jgi:hypothetical protein
VALRPVACCVPGLWLSLLSLIGAKLVAGVGIFKNQGKYKQ